MAAKAGAAVSQKPLDEAFYDKVMARGEYSYIAMAPMNADRIAHAFICAQKGGQVTDFVHAIARPTADGGYTVDISQKIRHQGYMRGLELLPEYKAKGCDLGMKQLDRDLVGTAETAAVRPHVVIR